MARLAILSNDEFDNLYKIPKFTDEERESIFALDTFDKNYLNTIDSLSVKINYILHVGYFRTSQYFFSLEFNKVTDDVLFIIKTYFPESSLPKKEIGKRQYYENRKVVINKYEMKVYTNKFEKQLTSYLKTLVKQHSAPKYLFDSLLNYCHQQKTIRPSYTILQELIAKYCNNEKNRLRRKLYTLMDSTLRNSLDNLLEKDNLFYHLTLIKQDQKSFSTSAIRSTVEKNQLLEQIYQKSVTLIKDLNISEQNIILYSDLAERYTVYGLRNIKQPNLVRLYLLCYVHHRFLKINDHLIASFIYKVNGYTEDADLYQKEEIYKAQLLDQNNRILAADILSLHTDKKVPDNKIREQSFAIIPKTKFQQFIQKIKTPHLTPDYYKCEYYSKNSHAIKQNIRLTFKALNFQTKSENLNKAIIFLKTHFQNNKSFSDYNFDEIPIEFISPTLKRYIIVKMRSKNTSKKIKTINFDCYEFMIYFYIKKNLASGGVTIKDSLSYKDLGDELIPMKKWDDDHISIIKDLAEQTVSIDIKKILDNFEILLGKRYQEVNHKINSGSNDKIKIKYNKKGEVVHWNLPYKKADDGVNNPFFESMNLSTLSQIIKFTDDNTKFTKNFNHIFPSQTKIKPELASLSACLVAKATGNDIYKMKDMSDVKEQDLIYTYSNFIRLGTLTSASNTIINKVATLPIFEQYKLADYGIHASVDGQKLETRYNTIKARYSSKYYGFGKGISAYTLFANCLPICTKVIGANEHESNFLFDILRSNNSEVEISAVSGDMHSINRVNFIILYMFGYRFMPRFTKLDKKVNKHLVCFDKPTKEKYNNYHIKPNKQVNKDLVIEEWENLLRIFATLSYKKNTQANIVKKLSSYKSNNTLKALIELDKIVMSLYMLDYIDDEEMRQNVHRSLNRGESYHQLVSAIAKVGGKKLLGRNEIELSVNNECTRLIAIIIIFYNALFLSRIYEYCKNKGMVEECKKIVRLSPVAWVHINLLGKYEFNTNIEILDIKTTIIKLVTIVESHKISQLLYKNN
jgi:TnpA family transposase